MQGLLRVICDLAKAAAQTENSNRMVVSLYAVLLCEILVAAPVVSCCLLFGRILSLDDRISIELFLCSTFCLTHEK